MMPSVYVISLVPEDSGFSFADDDQQVASFGTILTQAAKMVI